MPKTAVAKKERPIPIIVGRQAKPDFPTDNFYDINFSFSNYIERKNYTFLEGKNILQVAKSNPKLVIEFLFDTDPICQDVLAKFVEFSDTPFQLIVTKNLQEYQIGQKFIDEIVSKFDSGINNDQKYNSKTNLRSVYRSLLQSVFVWRAVALEVVFNENEEFEELFVVNPKTINWKYEKTEKREIPYQKNPDSKEDIKLDIPKFFFIAHNPWPGDIHPRETVYSTIYPTVFKLSVLSDMKQIIHKSGFPRLKVSVKLAELMNSAPKNFPVKIDGKEVKDQLEWIQVMFSKILKQYEDLEPDDAVVHDDTSNVSYLETQHTGRGMWDPTDLLSVIESSIASSLNTYATLIGRHFAGSGEGYSSFEILSQEKIWEGLRESPNEILSKAFTFILYRLGAMRGEVKFDPEEIILEPKQKRAQYRQTDLKNIEIAFIQGGISEREMQVESRRIVGLKGSVPKDAKFRPEFFGKGTSQAPQIGRDPQDEPNKEDKRRDSNRRRRQDRSENQRIEEEALVN